MKLDRMFTQMRQTNTIEFKEIGLIIKRLRTEYYKFKDI